jgi:acyl carrier protein
MDKLELFNKVIDKARPASGGEVSAKSLDDNIVEDIGLDSLDIIMISIYIAEIYGVSEEIAKDLKPTTVSEFFELYEKHATHNPETIKEAIDNIKF